MPRKTRARRAHPLPVTLGAGVTLLAAVLIFMALASGDDAPGIVGQETSPVNDSRPAPLEPPSLKGNMTVIAHRGTLWGLHPENSLAGIRAALAGRDVDGVEVDVLPDEHGDLRLEHHAPIRPDAPRFIEGAHLLLEAGVAPHKFLVLDIKGDAAVAYQAYAEAPRNLLPRLVFMVRTVEEAQAFRSLAPDARLYVTLPHEKQGQTIPKSLGAEAVAVTNGIVSYADIQQHRRDGTPIVLHAINSLTNAKALGIHAVLVAVPPPGIVGERLGPPV